MAVFDLNQPASSLSEEDDVAASSSINTGFDSHVVSVSSSINTGCDSFASHDDNASYSNILKTSKAAIHHEFIDTPGGSVYWVPRVSASVLQVSGDVYCDSLVECMRFCKCKIGALRAHNLYTDLKGSSSLVHGTQTEFKNFTRGVNCFIGYSDAQMLITRMEERQEFTKDFSFDYFVEDAELCCLFWADEVVKCNYKEFGDIVSFDATYKTKKYKMVFVPFTAIDNHMRSVTIGSGLLKKETTEAYGWLLRAFKKAFVRAPNIVVIDQDGAMRLVVSAEFPESKHKLCMWHIMQKDSNLKGSWLCSITGMSSYVGCTVCIIDEETIKPVGLPEVIDNESTSENVEEEINLHQKVTGHYKLSPDLGFYNWYQSLVALDLGLIRWQQSGRSEGSRVSSQTLTSKHMDWFTAGLDVPTAKLFLIPTGKLMVPAGSSWFLLVVPAGRLCGSCWSAYGSDSLISVEIRWRLRYGRFMGRSWILQLDSCVHMLRNNEPKLSVFVNKMKAIKSELEAELPIVPTRIVSDFVQEFMGVYKPDKVKVKNPTGVRLKGREKQKRIKSGREISMKKNKNNVDVLYPAVVVPGGSDHVDGGLRDGASRSVSV
ncbi:FAR1-related sequence 5-like protein [Tanacetum coccineum]